MFNEEYKTLLDIIEQFKKLVEEINIGDYIKNPDILDLIENLNKNFENTIDVLYNILGNYPFNDEFDWFKILESDRDELLDDLFELEDLFDIIQTNNKDYEGKEPLSSEIPINQEVIDQIISRIAKITQEKIIVD